MTTASARRRTRARNSKLHPLFGAQHNELKWQPPQHLLKSIRVYSGSVSPMSSTVTPSLLNEDFYGLNDFFDVTETDIRDMAESFSKCSPAANRINFGMRRIKWLIVLKPKSDKVRQTDCRAEI